MEPEGRERVRSLARADGVRLSAALWLTALPVTPFHFGPGLALKGAAAPMFSWSAFAVAQVVIDCETIYYLVKRGVPGAPILSLVPRRRGRRLLAAVLFRVVVHASFIRFPRLIVPLTATSTARGEISILGVLLGGLVGGLSHPLLDGVMHPDVRPFMPWSDYNPFLGLIGLAPLHLACIASAVLGAAGVALWKRRSKGRST
jgi:membrane-bound metal-dependent hydrolase YbcI (DUF457 family)